MESSKKKKSEKDRPRSKNPKHVSAKTGNRSAARGEKSPAQNSTNKVLLSIVVCVVLAAAIGALMFALFGMSTSDCQKYLKTQTEGSKNNDIALSPLDITECLETTCTFDVLQCDAPCPFGFESVTESGCTKSCDCAVEGRFQGDVFFGADDVSEMLEKFGHKEKEDFEIFFATAKLLWNNLEVGGRFKVPYKMLPGLPKEDYQVWVDAIGNLSKLVCLDLIPWSDESDFIEIYPKGSSCGALVGRHHGRNNVNLAPGCFFQTTIHHELFHVFGFFHEHSRPDRDGHVNIYFDNIQPQKKHNFEKERKENIVDLDTEYDFQSAMQYPSYVFAEDKRKPTITGKPGNIMRGNQIKKQFLTPMDVLELKKLYECPEDEEKAKEGEWGDWLEWSDCSDTCGGGLKSRFRGCFHKPTKTQLTVGCEGMPVEYKACNEDECPSKTGKFLEWKEWSKCGKTCGEGHHSRLRHCSEVLQCTGSYFDYKPCIVALCDTGEAVVDGIYGEWANWEKWQHCDATCGKGSKLRVRPCMNKGKEIATTRCKANEKMGKVYRDGQAQVEECKLYDCKDVPPGLDDVASPTQGPQPTINAGSGNTPSPLGPSLLNKPTQPTPIEVTGIFKENSKVNILCQYGRLLSGKFNSDKYADLICFHPDSYIYVYYSEGEKQSGAVTGKIGWHGPSSLCSFVFHQANYQLFARDMDQDGDDDIVCYNPLTKEVEIGINNGGKFRAVKDWRGQRESCDSVIHIEDVNGDGKNDLVCGNAANAFRQIYLNGYGD